MGVSGIKVRLYEFLRLSLSQNSYNLTFLTFNLTFLYGPISFFTIYSCICECWDYFRLFADYAA